MRFGIPLMLLVVLVTLTGCTTRSISYHSGNENWLYRGELSQMSVIAALSADGEVHGEGPVTIPGKGRMILIQSGQAAPDPQMVLGMPSGVEVLPFSGIPSPLSDGVSWRQAARAGGVQTVLVYWGTIESSRVNQVTKAISWTPVTAWIPDEEQQMRVAVSAVVADVASGRWSLITAVSRSSQVSSSLFSRAAQDQKQISELKQDAFEKFLAALQATIR
jgi:hypothetical protein